MGKTPILLTVLGIAVTAFIAPDASAGRLRAHVGGHTTICTDSTGNTIACPGAR